MPAPSAPMEGYRLFVDRLDELIREVRQLRVRSATWASQVDLALDGEAGKQLRARVPLSDRKASSAFFTNQGLAQRLAQRLQQDIKGGAAVLDPACGAGNLLLACARHLPVHSTLSETIGVWGERLHGYDLHAPFIDATRRRLILLALQAGAEPDVEPDRFNELLPNLIVRDALQAAPWVAGACVVLNPPFGKAPAPDGCGWAMGKVSLAGLFVERALRERPALVAGVLPDVLRTGTRYGRWRAWVGNTATVSHLESAGRFDPWADVDVFVTEMRPKNLPLFDGEGLIETAWWSCAELPSGSARLEDVFAIKVGEVVPHRHPLSGWKTRDAPARPYLEARSCDPWAEVEVGETTAVRKFSGGVHTPPFVVVRRTSSPSDRRRAVATVIVGEGPVTVENHLVVFKPRDGRLDTCRSLQRMLDRDETDRWLNERIRCRHLTTSALKDLPWSSD